MVFNRQRLQGHRKYRKLALISLCLTLIIISAGCTTSDSGIRTRGPIMIDGDLVNADLETFETYAENKDFVVIITYPEQGSDTYLHIQATKYIVDGKRTILIEMGQQLPDHKTGETMYEAQIDSCSYNYPDSPCESGTCSRRRQTRLIEEVDNLLWFFNATVDWSGVTFR